MIIEPTCHYNEQEINQDNPQSDGAQMRLEIQIRLYQLMYEITSASIHTCTCLHDQHIYSLKQSDSRGNNVQRRKRKRSVQRRMSSCAYAGSEIERCVDLFFSHVSRRVCEQVSRDASPCSFPEQTVQSWSGIS
jgi:hypothetical protein